MTKDEHIAKLREALEDAVDGLEGMDLHIDNPLYDRLRKVLEEEYESFPASAEPPQPGEVTGDDYETWQEKREQEARIARFKGLAGSMPGADIRAEGFDDGTFYVSWVDADADDSGRAISCSGTVMEGEMVDNKPTANELAEYINLAFDVSSDYLRALQAALGAKP